MSVVRTCRPDIEVLIDGQWCKANPFPADRIRQDKTEHRSTQQDPPTVSGLRAALV